MKHKLIRLFLIYFLIFSGVSSLQAASLAELQKKYTGFQQKENYEGMASVLESMLANGYQTKERYRSLADIYFFIKKDAKGLAVWKRFAKWSGRDAGVWQTYSDVLIWKKRTKEGIRALEKAAVYSKGNPDILIKLAGVYEYNKRIVDSIMTWGRVTKQSGDSLETGKLYVEFLLRNSRAPEAAEYIDKLLEKHGALGSDEFNLVALKTYVWSNRVNKGTRFLPLIKVSQLEEKDLDYMFKLASMSGNLGTAEKILDRLASLGRDVWHERIDILIKAGKVAEARESVLEKIDDSSETAPLLKLLYETYRAQRMLAEEMQTLEKLIMLEPDNRIWQSILYRYYVYHQQYERGIDFYEDVLDQDGKENHQLTLFYYSKLLLLDGDDLDEFDEAIAKLTDFEYKIDKLYMMLQKEEKAENGDALFSRTLDILSAVKDEAPEIALKRAKKKNPDAEMEEDYYLNTLQSLFWIAELNGNSKERQKYGRMAYETVKKRYAQFPTRKRLYQIIEIGRSFATQEEKERDLLFAVENFPEHYFYLHYYRFLKWEGRSAEGAKIFFHLKKSARNLRENKNTAEHTFGFIPSENSAQLFKELLKQDPGYLGGVKRLGQIALYTENYRQAEYYFNRYLGRYEYDPEITFSLGEALFNQNKFSDSEDAFEKVVQLLDHPGREAYENELMAIALMRLSKPESAKEILQFAKRQTPDSISISLNILEALVELRQWDEVLRLIVKENLMKAEPKRVGVIKYAALFQLERIEECRELLELLLIDYPQDKEVVSTKGFFHVAMGEDHLALPLFEKAVRLPPEEEELQKDYIELDHRYQPNAGLFYTASATPDDSSYSIARIYGSYLVNETDKVSFNLEQYDGKQDIENGYSASATDISAKWSANLSGFQRYSAALHVQNGIGFEGNYSKTRFGLQGEAALLYEVPNHDSLGLVAADTHSTGFRLGGSYYNTAWNHSWDLEYVSLSHDLKAYDTNPELSVSESKYSLGFTQSFLRFPQQLAVRGQYVSASVSGDESALITEQTEMNLRSDYSYYFNSNWKFQGGVFMGDDSSTKVKNQGAEAYLTYRSRDRLFHLGYYMNQEEGEITKTNTTKYTLQYEWYY